FSNIGALLKYCLNAQKDVLLLCSGWKNRFCIEDTLFAGRFADELIRNGRFESDNDAVKAARDLWKVAKSDLVSYICDTEHYQRLKKNGLENEIEYCLAENTTSVVPIYDKTIKAFINQRK
ncbi:MAG: 2-phosphosulfolactate phosphatase, partial [Bacteroidetes bacterium]|nr:2-phosphosulfolactate phosphatase [Bacteroidota bacterium]